jgi:serine protease Do
VCSALPGTAGHARRRARSAARASTLQGGRPWGIVTRIKTPDRCWPRSRLALTLFVAACASVAPQPLPVEEILLRAKPAVVLVSVSVAATVKVDCDGEMASVTPPTYEETGTAWFLDANGFLITSAHVVQPAYAPEPWLASTFADRAAEAACVPVWLSRLKLKAGERADVEERLQLRAREAVAPSAEVSQHAEIHVVLPNGSRLPAEVRKYGRPLDTPVGRTSRGPDLALLKVSGRDYPLLRLANSDTVLIGEPVHVLGYPAVVLAHELLSRSARVESSVTSGAVSGFKQDVAGETVIQTDASAAWGNSGGPAVNARGEVVGVLTFISLGTGRDGGIVQGFNFLIPSNAARRFVGDTDVVLGNQSRFDAAWWAGLRDFFRQRFESAAAHFDEAERIIPGLPDVTRMRADAAWFIGLSRKEGLPATGAPSGLIYSP